MSSVHFCNKTSWLPRKASKDMIPFFRKIRYRLARDNDFYKYSRYAIGEIILVVVGILIALQVNNWNQSRKERVKEGHYLSQLKEEFKLTRKELSRVIRKTGDVERITNLLLSIQETSSDSMSNDELDSLILRSRGYTILMSSESTIVELISTGNLGLIQNDSLRSYLASWETSLQPILTSHCYQRRSEIICYLISNVETTGIISEGSLKI